MRGASSCHFSQREVRCKTPVAGLSADKTRPYPTSPPPTETLRGLDDLKKRACVGGMGHKVLGGKPVRARVPSTLQTGCDTHSG